MVHNWGCCYHPEIDDYNYKMSCTSPIETTKETCIEDIRKKKRKKSKHHHKKSAKKRQQRGKSDKKLQDKQKAMNKTVIGSSHLRCRVAELFFFKKRDSTICCLQETSLDLRWYIDWKLIEKYSLVNGKESRGGHIYIEQ